MKLSMQSLIFDHPRDALRSQTYAMLADLGFAGLEVVPETFTLDDARLAGRLAADYGMETLTGWSLFAKHDPASPSPAVRAAAVDQLRRLIDLAEAMGAHRLGGVLYAGCGRLSGYPPTETEWKYAVATLHQVADQAAAAGVVLCLEPATRGDSHIINTAEQLVAFLDLVDHPTVSGLLDTWQMHREECDMESAIRLAAPRCQLFHLSESHRGALGWGTMAWPTVFQALKASGYDDWIGAEIFFNPQSFIGPHAKVWRKLGDDTRSVAAKASAFIHEHLMP